MLLKKKEHQERKNASLEKVQPTSNMILFWVTLTECTPTLFVLSSRVARSRFFFFGQSGLFRVYKKNLSLRFILDARRSNQHVKVPPKFSTATGDAFSRVELLLVSPDETAAPALHIASGDVENAFRHMGIPEWLRPHFCLRRPSASAFGLTGKIVQRSRFSGEQTLFHAPLGVANGAYLEHALLSACQLSLTVNPPSLLGPIPLLVFAGTTLTILVPSAKAPP